MRLLHKMALTRRAFATALTGSLAVPGLADAALPSGRRATTDDTDLLDAALRGLARSSTGGDPVLAEKAGAALAQLGQSDPESAALVRVYRRYDVAAAGFGWHAASVDMAAPATFVLLHGAIRAARAVSFRYTDRDGAVTTRTVLPLALVHPPQGVKLLARCEMRQADRQFFVRAMEDITLSEGTFGDRRLALLVHLADGDA